MGYDLIKLRKYSNKDCQMLYDWRVHPLARKFYFSSEVFSFESHKKWFNSFLSKADRIGLIMENEGDPVGQIRFEPSEYENSMKIAIAVSPEQMGKGYGTKLLEEACKYKEVTEKCMFLIGEVKTANKASERIFEKNNFTNIGIFVKDNIKISLWLKPTQAEYSIKALKEVIISRFEYI